MTARIPARGLRGGTRTWLKPLGLVGLAGVLAVAAPAQVTLNEVMADNQSAVENGSDFPDYIELYNTSTEPVSLAGMSLTDNAAQPRLFVFPAGTTIAGLGYRLVWCDTNTAAPGLHTGFALGAKGERVRLYAADGVTQVDTVRYGLQLPNQSVGRVPDGTGAWVLTRPTPRAANVAKPLGAPSQLRLNEWMARPSAGNDWLEIYNGESLPVPLAGLVITDNPGGTPTNRAIPALSFIAARGFVPFQASDLAQNDADHLDFKLSSSSETLTIYASDRTTILDRVSYGSQSEDLAQGRAPDGSDHIVFFPAGRATPGAANLTELTAVVVSEVLSHTDPPLEDAIELQNVTAAAVDISHWWLSDSGSQPQKFRVPAGTVIPAGGYVVFYEYQFGAGPTGFTFNSSEGDDMFLSVGDAGGNLTGQQTMAEFGALKNGRSVGRYQTSVGVDFVPLSRRTFGVDNPSSQAEFRSGAGLPNAAPRVGPVVITEIMYRPPPVAGLSDTDGEFLELHNPGPSARPLFDPSYPTNGWRLRDGVTYDLPLGMTIPAGGYLLLVSFDPGAQPDKLAAFRSHYVVPAGVPIYGPYDGQLNDSGEAVELLWPDEPQPPDKPNAGFVPYEQVERLEYSSAAPWPSGTAGTGHSLQRRGAVEYGNDPANWLAAAPTPGRARVLDTDADGMPDDWESTHGLDPGSAADATADPDGDLANNLAEYQAGTNPTNPRSVLRISALEPGGTSCRIMFRAVAGRTYAVQSCGFLDGPWRVATNLLAVPLTGEMTLTLPSPAAAGGFFRIVTPALP